MPDRSEPSAVRLDLGAGPDPAELIRRAAGEPGLVALIGDWFDGGAVVAARPALTTTDVGDLDESIAPGDGGLLAGSWFGTIGCDGRACFGRYDELLRHRDGRWWFESVRGTGGLDRWRTLLNAPASTVSYDLGAVEMPSRAAHLAAVERAVELIRAGELYQVNVCTRLAGDFTGDPAALFAALVDELAPARAALVTTPGRTLVCASPELFLDVRGRDVRTAPIKGTLPRTPGDGNDRRLRASAKDAAENVMIVDLLRNDLGRVGETGSVRVDSLLDVEAHPGVWHLVSAVRARLRADVGTRELLAATLPPGSVTGAPKLRALAAIAELESVPRGDYTGVVGAVVPGGRAELAVTIRSFEIAAGRWQLGVGGGVTADSVPMSEWHECRHKAAPLLRGAQPPEPVPAPPAEPALLETLLAVNGRPLLAADHLARLDRSLRELTGAGLPDGLDGRVRAAAARVPSGRAVVRIVVRDGTAEVTSAPLGPPPTELDLMTVPRPDALWRHKWADRALHVAAEAQAAPAEPLFLAADGTVLETSRGNVFLVRENGTLVTPPMRDDLLPGVTRRAVLDLARDTGRPTELCEFGLDELLRHAAFRTSSLGLVVAIGRVDGRELPRADDIVRPIAQALSIGGHHGS